MPTNIPVITYLQRYWLILVASAVFIALCLNDWAFQHFGALIYIPAVALVSISTLLLVVHLLFRETIDKYIHDGDFLKEFYAIEPRLRVILTLAILAVFFLGGCIVAAGVGK